jgi:hypothetical protein
MRQVAATDPLVTVIGGRALRGSAGLGRLRRGVFGWRGGENSVLGSGHGGVGALHAGPDRLVELLHVDLVFLGQVLGLGLGREGGGDGVDWRSTASVDT